MPRSWWSLASCSCLWCGFCSVCCRAAHWGHHLPPNKLPFLAAFAEVCHLEYFLVIHTEKASLLEAFPAMYTKYRRKFPQKLGGIFLFSSTRVTAAGISSLTAALHSTKPAYKILATHPPNNTRPIGIKTDLGCPEVSKLQYLKPNGETSKNTSWKATKKAQVRGEHRVRRGESQGQGMGRHKGHLSNVFSARSTSQIHPPYPQTHSQMHGRVIPLGTNASQGYFSAPAHMWTCCNISCLNRFLLMRQNKKDGDKT